MVADAVQVGNWCRVRVGECPLQVGEFAQLEETAFGR